MPSSSWTLRWGAAVLVLAFGATGCSAQPESSVPPTSDAASADPGPGIPAQLRFTAQALDGADFSGRSLTGKDTVFWFWAPWCSDCRREAPHVAAAAKAHPEVTFVGVAGLGELPAMRDFVDDYGVGAFVHLADMDGSLWKRFGVVRQPATAFIDDSGTVEVVRGSLGADQLERHLGRLTRN